MPLKPIKNKQSVNKEDSFTVKLLNIQIHSGRSEEGEKE
jgi:hypothetical protein